MRNEAKKKQKYECTFNPLISQKSQEIFGEYQKVFLRQKSQEISRKELSNLKRHSSQNNFYRKKKTYKNIHYDRSIAKRQKRKRMKPGMKISNNEYMLGFDRNRKGSVFEHLYDQRKTRESKKIRLFQRIQEQQCPFQPKIKNKSKSKGNYKDFLKRNEMFLRRKKKFILKEELKRKENLFKPNLNKRGNEKKRENLHQELYDQRDKENVKRQRLVERYKVRKLIEGK
jgi:hypothetical protein